MALDHDPHAGVQEPALLDRIDALIANILLVLSPFAIPLVVSAWIL